MRTRCDEAQSQLHETNEACKSLLDRAGSLRDQRSVYTRLGIFITKEKVLLSRQEVSTRQSIVTAFLDRFTLTSEEVEAIVSREVSINTRFFSAMSKAERMRSDCRVLMSGEDGPTKAGYDSLHHILIVGTHHPIQCRYSYDDLRISRTSLRENI